jgi:hypothetical protein
MSGKVGDVRGEGTVPAYAIGGQPIGPHVPGVADPRFGAHGFELLLHPLGGVHHDDFATTERERQSEAPGPATHIDENVISAEVRDERLEHRVQRPARVVAEPRRQRARPPVRAGGRGELRLLLVVGADHLVVACDGGHGRDYTHKEGAGRPAPLDTQSTRRIRRFRA